MLSRTDSNPDGSGVTLPEILRGACLRLKTMPFLSRANEATGAVLSSGLCAPGTVFAGTWVPQAPSEPVVTHVAWLRRLDRLRPRAGERELSAAVGACRRGAVAEADRGAVRRRRRRLRRRIDR